jgi:hypothetical protein
VIRKKSSSGACGAVRRVSHGDGAVIGAARDRRPSGTRIQKNGILESAAHAELRLELNGECDSTARTLWALFFKVHV